MGQTKPAAGLKSLNRAADTLSTLLAQEVKELNERQKAARRENTPDPGMMGSGPMKCGSAPMASGVNIPSIQRAVRSWSGRSR